MCVSPVPLRSIRRRFKRASPVFNGTYRFRTAMNGIENSTRLFRVAGARRKRLRGVGGEKREGESTRSSRTEIAGARKSRGKRKPRENDISDRRRRRRGMAARRARRWETRAEEGGGEKQIYESRARMIFQQCGRLEQLLAEYCNHYCFYISERLGESSASASVSVTL